MTEEEKMAEVKPDCVIPRKTAYMILLIGLLLIAFAYGCDMVNKKGVDKIEAAAALAQSEFESKWELKEMEINEMYDYDRNPEFKVESPEYKAWEKAKNTKIENKQKAVDELTKAYNAEKKEMKMELYEMSMNAKNAKNSSKGTSYLLSWMFFLGMLALVFSVVVIAFIGDKIERIIMLILVAAIAYSFFGGNIPFV